MDDINKVIDNIEEYSPVLLLGSAVQDFKKVYTSKIEKVKNIEDVRDLVGYYKGIRELDYILVIDGLSFLGKDAIFTLLKLVEDSELDIILLSKFDNVPAVIVSRVKFIVKYSNKECKSQLLELEDGIDIVEEKVDRDSHYFDRLKYIIKYSPKMYYVENNMGRIRNKNKIKDIIT